MKKWSLMTLVLLLVLFASAGTALAAKGGKPDKPAKSAAKTITITHIEKGSEPGMIYLGTDSTTTAEAIQKAVTIAGVKSITWAAASGHKDGKMFTATFQAKLKADYQLKAAAPFALKKGIDGKIKWNLVGVSIDNVTFAPEPGQFSFTLKKPAKLADLQGKIVAVAGGAQLPVAISGSGTSFSATVTGAKAGVEYTLKFAEPFPASSFPHTWAKKPEPPKEEELPPVEGDVGGSVYAD